MGTGSTPQGQPRGWFDRLAFRIFGTVEKERDVNWVPGNGSHGGRAGGVPQFVPYSADWDPTHERQLSKLARRRRRAAERDRRRAAEWRHR